MGKTEVFRIEDFIALAQKGHHIEASIDLKKEIVTKKIRGDETGEIKGESELYLLLAEYTFRVAQEVKKVSKIYIFGTSEESISTTNQNILFANERLKIDYARLINAHITVEEKFFV